MGSARIYVSHEGGTHYGFEHEEVHDGQAFTFGGTVLTARHTPDHTPEHVSYEVAEKGHPDTPWGVLTGDSLFVNSAGRPDLLGSSETEKLTQQLFGTLRNYYLKLPDGVSVYPAHGHGSPCGADIGDRLQSTIGHERRFNPYLQLSDFEQFRRQALEGAPPVPTHYPRMKKLNAEGPEIIGGLPRVPALPPQAFKEAWESKTTTLIDTRSMLAFGGGHIAGALNIGAAPMLSIWAGWLLDPEEPILLVLEKDTALEEVLKLFMRTGYHKFAGYLSGGMKAWDNAGLPLDEIRQITVHELHLAQDVQILDVRSPSEWEEGRVPGAVHIFLPDLRKKLRTLNKSATVAVYCDSGYRASLAASMLKQEGFNDVRNVPGSWQAWKKVGLPIEKGDRE